MELHACHSCIDHGYGSVKIVEKNVGLGKDDVNSSVFLPSFRSRGANIQISGNIADEENQKANKCDTELHDIFFPERPQ